ncbi:MAG: hypothetical protein V4720_06230 [Pseudomonadota bacterium]
MTQANDSLLVTPGTGATLATHAVASKEHQVVMIADADGHIQGSPPVYKLIVNGSAVGASKVHCDLFNADGTLILKVVSARVIPDIDTAVTGVVSAEVHLTRTTAVGTGGTAMTLENTALTGISIVEMDTSNPALDADITARTQTAGGATAGALLGTRHIFTEETNAGAALAAMIGAQFVEPGYPIMVRPSQGLRFVQGAVASVGTLNFEIIFEVL